MFLTANHKDIDLGERKEWYKIFYSQVYDFFKSRIMGKLYKEEFNDFLSSRSNHSVEDYNYAIMRKRFV